MHRICGSGSGHATDTNDWKDKYPEEAESLEWWQEVFGDAVSGWTFKSSAQLFVDGETTNVGPKFREYMARRMAQS